jgi:hypothetical protein
MWHFLPRLQDHRGWLARRLNRVFSAHVRRPRLLALSHATFQGAFFLVALGGQGRRRALGRAPTAGIALGRQPDTNRRGSRLASGRPAELILPRLLLPQLGNLAPFAFCRTCLHYPRQNSNLQPTD